MKFNQNLNENWENELWHAIGEPDVTTLRNMLRNIRKLFDDSLESYSVNSLRGEETLLN